MKHTKAKESVASSIKKYLSSLAVRFQKHMSEAHEIDRRIEEAKDSHIRKYPYPYLKGWY